jgi:hypothetical protein
VKAGIFGGWKMLHMGNFDIGSKNLISGLQYLVQEMGLDVGNWAMTRYPDSFAFTSPERGLYHLQELLMTPDYLLKKKICDSMHWSDPN